MCIQANKYKSEQEEPLQTLGGGLGQEGSEASESCFSEKAKEISVGGQAVIEGVMMRHKNAYALAIRDSKGDILAERKSWYKFTTFPLYKKPYFRGFPMLVETMINGVKTLTRSAELNTQEEEKPLSKKELVLTLIFSAGMAIGLFIILPHFMSYAMKGLGYSGDVETFSFQIWDGLFKFLIFLSYLFAISFIPDIRRVFQFHGAEHKVIAAYENCPENGQVDVESAQKQTRLHPRCGTTFLLFVLSIAILVHTIVLPPFLWIWKPESAFFKHSITLIIKILLMVPISAIAYELIRSAAKMQGLLGRVLKAPGLLLQNLTTVEPEKEHIEVALVALALALKEDSLHPIVTPSYIVLE